MNDDAGGIDTTVRTFTVTVLPVNDHLDAIPNPAILGITPPCAPNIPLTGDLGRRGREPETPSIIAISRNNPG